MFGDHNTSQKPDDNKDQNGQVNAPSDPPNPAHVSSFNMDQAAGVGPALTPSKSAPIEPPAPPPPLPDIDSEDRTNNNLPLTLPTPQSSDDSKPDDSSKSDDQSSDEPKSSSYDDENLLKIKQQALSQLAPMLAHLDQAPEEKFRTYMMMIQANDDKSLINDAYEAAQQIPDEKAKAHALLDVINEINYFTGNENSDD